MFGAVYICIFGYMYVHTSCTSVLCHFQQTFSISASIVLVRFEVILVRVQHNMHSHVTLCTLTLLYALLRDNDTVTYRFI
jgi:hypothetical protein